MLLDARDILKVADFAGSSIHGSDASIDYEVRSRLPGSSKPTIQSEIFALGSTLYELETGFPPYSDKPERAVQHLYAQERFPVLSERSALGPIIKNCWERRYSTVSQVVDSLERLNSHTLKHKEGQLNLLGRKTSARSTIDPTPTSHSKDVESVPVRDRQASTTFVPHPSQRRPVCRQVSEVERKVRQRKKKEERPEFWWRKKIKPWLRLVQNAYG